jgi:hypothetical protein
MLLRYFPALRRLYLAHNSVNSLHAIMPCQLLEVLDARSNDLIDLDGVIQVLRSLPHLSQVEMEGNPCAAHRLYRANLVASAGLKMLDGRCAVLQFHTLHSASFSFSVVTSLDIESGRQMLLEAAPPSTPRSAAARPAIRMSPPPNERPTSGRPKTASGGVTSAAVQAATAAIAASAALSRNPIFLECAPRQST